jgi:hypothetical protein
VGDQGLTRRRWPGQQSEPFDTQKETPGGPKPARGNFLA